MNQTMETTGVGAKATGVGKGRRQLASRGVVPDKGPGLFFWAPASFVAVLLTICWLSITSF